ncbi:hypothetical protein QJS10_CPB11g02212 [Acorus calamus]|uniref:DC1 domain-containing protein n=1 Tax=Acorus calamus TaxID=4465 RepID=A0AAV9DZG4_ACOCL|nr:hypothetical protein QJS10_CPB11g02212 [Acorus calamus]
MPSPSSPSPAYPERTFRCDACGRQGDGFSYHCGVCGLDVHALCASMPLSVTHAAHAHPLGLEFFPPYNNKGFSCDVCRGTGSNHWLYRCAACEFDAHLSCATAKAGPALSPGLQQQSPGPQQTQLQNRPFYGQQYQHLQPQSPRVQQFQTLQQQPLRPQQYQLQQQQLLLLQQQQQQLQQQHLLQQQQMFSSPRVQARPNGFVQNNAQNYQQTGSGQALNSLMNQATQGVIDGGSQQIGQDLVQGITGGGDGGGGGGDGGGDGGSGSGSVFDVVSSIVGGVFGGSDESSSQD